MAVLPKEFKDLALGTWGRDWEFENVFQGVWVQ